MKTTTRLPSRSEMNDAIKALTSAGWTHTLTVMSDRGDKDPHGYGLRFERGAERFWLNKDTISSLPK